MQPIFARGNSRTLQRLKALRQEAQTDSATRVILRLQAIMLSVQGRTTGQIAQGLQVDHPFRVLAHFRLTPSCPYCEAIVEAITLRPNI